MRDARREARERRLVPVGETQGPCGGAYLRFGHAGFEQREADAAAEGRGVPGTMVTRVIRGRPVRKVRQPELLLHWRQRVEELLFAVKAAVRVVAGVGLELDLVGVDLDQACAHRAGEGPRLLLL